jgi:hypothetical protein
MILVVEGTPNSYVDSFVRKVLGKTGWPFYNYAPEYVDTYNKGENYEDAWYYSRDALVYSFEQNNVKDVVVSNFCFEVVASGLVERGWNAMVAIRRAESLFKRLSDMGAVLVRCSGKDALKSAPNASGDAVVEYKTKVALFDLLYDVWPGEKRTTSVLEFDHTIYNLRI